MTAFDKWAELDPAKLQRDIETSGCSDVTLTRYVDVEDMVRRVNAKHPGTVDRWGNLDPHRLGQQLSVGCAGGGGGNTYVAKAVHFDGGVKLSIASLLATDNSTCSVSGWFKTTGTPGSTVVWTGNPDNGVNLFSISGSGPDKGWTLELGEPNAPFLDHELFANDLPSNDGNWHHVIASLNTLTSATDQLALYVDGVKSNGANILNGSNITADVFNGVPFVIGQDGSGDNYIGDIADLWIAPGVLLVESNGTISPANLAKFISGGKPVNPAGFPSAPILFSGDHTTFATNQGTGGAFTLTGTLTDASTSPSD